MCVCVCVCVCVTQVWTGLFLVDTTPVKATLSQKADDLIELLLNQQLDKSNEVSTVLHTRGTPGALECEMANASTMQALHIARALSSACTEVRNG